MNRFLVPLAELSWNRVLMVGLIALGLYWAIGYNDGKALMSQTEKAAVDLKEAERQLTATKEAIANAEVFEREVKETVDQFNRVAPEIMPEHMSAAELTTIISDVSNKAAVKILKTEPRPGLEKTDFYDTTKLVLSAEGNFSQLVMFLSYMSRIPKLMTFDHVDVGLVEAQSSSESPRLIFNGVLTGYRYTKPSPTSPPPKDPTKDAPSAPAGGAPHGGK